jgi:Phage portal protein, SPP1 Gp6-like
MADPLAWAADKLGLALRRRRDAPLEQEFLTAAADMGAGRVERYDLAEAYYRGEHRVRLTTRERKFLEASGLQYCENFCETIVDAMVDRLRVRGFGTESEQLATFAKETWADNRMDAGQLPVHEAAVKLGDAFVIVEGGKDGGKPRWSYNDPRQVKVVYDSGEPLYASKVWATSRPSASNPQGRPIRRLNVYWPHEVEKWFSTSSNGAWAPFRDNEDDEGNIVFWTTDGTPDGDPLGIPVVHFAHKPNPHYGISKLQGVIPQQDALNKSLVDLFWVMDAQGWPQQWGTGVKADAIKRHPGSLWTTEHQEGKFGQLEAADPTRSIASIESQIKRMASRSQTALHLMLAGGNLPSGETLKTSESGQTKAAGRFQTTGGNRWEDVVMISARVERAFGTASPPLDKQLECRWAQAESRNEIDEANTAVLWKTLGVSEDTILSRLGFDPAEERRKRERDGDTTAQQLLERARQMRAPTRPEERGGGRQPTQDPDNARV